MTQTDNKTPVPLDYLSTIGVQSLLNASQTRQVNLRSFFTLIKSVPDLSRGHFEQHPIHLVHVMYRRILNHVSRAWYDNYVSQILGFLLLSNGYGAWVPEFTTFWALCNILRKSINLSCVLASPSSQRLSISQHLKTLRIHQSGSLVYHLLIISFMRKYLRC
jgi:hypothetical protein